MNTISQMTDEEKHERLRYLSVKLGIPVAFWHLNVKAINPDGSIGDVHDDRMRTWNRNYWNYIFRGWGALSTASAYPSDATFGAGHLSPKQTNGSVRNMNDVNVGRYGFGLQTAGVGVTALGIVVGTSAAAESFEHYSLQALVTSGVGAGQLSYQAITFQQPTYNSGSKVWTSVTTRIMNNNSGGTIAINETGLYVHENANNDYVMLERSLLGATVNVLNGGQLTVTYTSTITFPA